MKKVDGFQGYQEGLGANEADGNRAADMKKNDTLKQSQKTIDDAMKQIQEAKDATKSSPSMKNSQ